MTVGRANGSARVMRLSAAAHQLPERRPSGRGGRLAAALVLATLVSSPAFAQDRSPSGPAGTPTTTGPGPAPLVATSTRHLDIAGEISTMTVSPGGRLSLRFAVTPKPGFYVYAPGATDYRVIRIRIEPSPLLRVHEPKYPESAMHFFEPLKEWVPVFGTAFELMQDITVGPTPRARTQLAKTRSLTVRGAVEYQACDARVCYLPTTIPFEWQVRVRPASGQPGRRGATEDPVSR